MVRMPRNCKHPLRERSRHSDTILYIAENTSLAATLIVPNTNIENTLNIGPNQYTTNAPMIQPTRGQGINLMNGNLAFLQKWSKNIMPEVKPIAVASGAANQSIVSIKARSGEERRNTDNQIE